MKNYHLKLSVKFLFLIVTFPLGSCSVNKWAVPAELAGHWKSDQTKITVRTEPEWMKFEFTKGISRIEFKIDANKTANGFIGAAEFKNGVVRKNGGNPERTGVAYIIQCGSIGKIFPEDPLEQKEVELWLGPVKGHMNAELRFTERMAHFPMANLKFRKMKN